MYVYGTAPLPDISSVSRNLRLVHSYLTTLHLSHTFTLHNERTQINDIQQCRKGDSLHCHIVPKICHAKEAKLFTPTLDHNITISASDANMVTEKVPLEATCTLSSVTDPV